MACALTGLLLAPASLHQALSYACRAEPQAEALATITALLYDPAFDPSALDHLGLFTATRLGFAELISRFLANPRADPAYCENEALMLAAQHGHAAVVSCLLSDPRVDPTARGHDAVRIALEHGHAAVADALLADGRVDPAARANLFLVLAAERGLDGIVEKLLGDPRVDPLARGNRALRQALRNGHTAVAERLLADPRVDPSQCDNEPIELAAAAGMIHTVQCMLRDPRVDPSAHACAALRRACRQGHVEVVRLLLADSRVDPSVEQNPFTNVKEPLRERALSALTEAAAAGNVAVVDMLLADARVSQSFVAARCALQLACREGHLEVVDRLLTDSCVSSVDTVASGLRTAAASGHLPLVDLLLQHPLLEASQLSAMLLLWLPAGKEDLPVLRRLLADPRVDLTQCSDTAWAGICSRADVDAVRLLLAHPSIACDLGRVPPKALYAAASSGNAALTSLLLGHPCADVAHALRLACLSNRAEVVELLLASPRLDAAALAGDCAALVEACDEGNIGLVRRLLADARVRPSEDASVECLSCAVRRPSLSLVEMLLAHPKLTLPSSPMASSNASAEILRGLVHLYKRSSEAETELLAIADRLLADPRLDPAADDNSTMTLACGSARFLKMAQRLLADPRVRIPAGALLDSVEERSFGCAAWLLQMQHAPDTAYDERACVDASFNENGALREVADALLQCSSDEIVERESVLQLLMREISVLRGLASGRQCELIEYLHTALIDSESEEPAASEASGPSDGGLGADSRASSSSHSDASGVALQSERVCSFMVSCAAAVAEQAWRRRRAVVLARSVAFSASSYPSAAIALSAGGSADATP